MGLDVIPTGELLGSVLFNQDEFDESTVVGLTTEFRRIVAAAVTDPDRDWKTL
jgi:condensation enzyme